MITFLMIRCFSHNKRHPDDSSIDTKDYPQQAIVVYGLPRDSQCETAIEIQMLLSEMTGNGKLAGPYQYLQLPLGLF